LLRPSGELFKFARHFKEGALGARSLNDSGEIVGNAIVPDSLPQKVTAWRLRSAGRELDLDRDSLKLGGAEHTWAYDVNWRGETAGSAWRNGGYRPVIWDEDGLAREQQTRIGGEVLAINEGGVAVGYIATRAETPDNPFLDLHAAIFQNGESRDLNELVPADYQFVLTRATGINADGQ
ncbi:hypothetical protein, partial [Micromonospora harpali]